MENTFLIVMSAWIGINVLFVIARLWVTRPATWRMDTCPRQFSTVCVKARPRHHV